MRKSIFIAAILAVALAACGMFDKFKAWRNK